MSADRKASQTVSSVSGVAPRDYQDLDGGLGREVNFRPLRYPSAELGPIGAQVNLVSGSGAQFSCELHDVSQNGVAFEWIGELNIHVGSTIPLLTVSFDRHETYRGAARVSSIRPIGDKTIVGASFLDTLMNIDDVLQLRDVKAWRGAGTGLKLKDRPWHVVGHNTFKTYISELRLFLLDAEQQLGELEKSLPWHVAHGDQDSPARSALIERVRAEVVDEIVASTVRINEALRGASPDDRQALKEFSQRHVHTLLLQSPWMRRAFEKPLGYPGDYEIMNGVYGNRFVGGSLFAKAVNLAFTSVPSADAVRARKNLIKGELHRLLDEAPADAARPHRILSIAAGPAQETYELLLERAHIDHPIEVVLFEQDKRALGYSYARLKRLVSERWPERVKIIYQHDSIKRLLRDPTIFSTFGKFDRIFSCGLFDYLQRRTAASLSASLFGNLAPSGQLYIGNMVPENPSRWFMEFHLDWSLIYREHAEMLEFARQGVPGAEVSIFEDETRLNPFVTLRYR